MVSRWIDQLITFIEEVIIPEHQVSGKAPVKVHIIGNSVGGHLAAHLANRRPDLVGSLCLLNPTPVWGLNLPGWSGHLPAPAIPKRIGRYLFDQIRDLRTIEKYLENAYARKDAFTEELVSYLCIVELGITLADYSSSCLTNCKNLQPMLDASNSWLYSWEWRPCRFRVNSLESPASGFTGKFATLDFKDNRN